MSIIEILDLIVRIATVVSVIIAIIAIWSSADVNRKQMNVLVFTTYTQRYIEIMDSFPADAFDARFSTLELPPSSKQLRLCVLKYLNMCSEQYYLREAKYIDDKVWAIWVRETKRILKSPLIIREWEILWPEFESYPQFLKFVETIQREGIPS